MSSNFWFLHRRAYREVDAFWDSVVERSPAEPIRPETIDAESAGTIRRLHALAPRPAPALDFAERLLAQLSSAIPEGQASTAPSHFFNGDQSEQNGETIMNSATIAAPAPPRLPALPKLGKRRCWAIAQLAGAALIIATLIGGYFVFFDNNTKQPALLTQETPEATPTGAWTHFKGNAARTGFAESGPIEKPIELWHVSAGGPCNQGPIVVGPTVYAACGDGVLYALNASDGSELWRFDAGLPIGGGLAVADGIVYFTDNLGAVHAIDRSTGAELWRTESLELGQIAIDSGKVVAPSGNGMLRAFDAATGAELWTYQVAERGELRGPGIANGIVYVGGEPGDLTAVDLETGELRWRGESGDGGTGTAFVSDGITTTTATDIDGSARIVAFDAETGEELWRRDGQLLTPVTNGVLAFAASQQNGTVFAFNLNDGAPTWEVVLGGVIRPMAVTSDVLYVPIDGEQAVVALDVDSGRELWRVTVDGGIGESVAVANDKLYVTTMAGSIYAFGPADPSLIVAPSGSADASPSPVTALDAAAIELVWESGKDQGPIAEPAGIALDPAGNLHVVDTGVNQIHVFGPNGEFIESWGEPGTGPGQFQFRQGGTNNGTLDFDAEGNIYVFDFTNHRIQKFDADRNFLVEWGTSGSENGQFMFPLGSVDRANERIYVADLENSRIQVFDLDGNFIDKWGSFGALNGQFTYPLCVIAAPDGTVYVGEVGNRIQAFDPNGTYLNAFGAAGSDPGEFGEVMGLAIDAGGNVFASDYTNGRIQIFRPDGTFIGIIDQIPGADELERPVGLAFDDKGYLYVADADRVLKLKLPPIGPV